MENLCLERRIVLHSELKTAAVLTDETFFEQMAEYFYETITPAVLMAFLRDLERMTDSEQKSFKHLNRYPYM